MFRRHIRSALLIDHENIPLPSESIANWLAWLEYGEFDDCRRRRLLAKRVYWNAANERHRETYSSFGFDVVYCEKFAGMKNGADIRMAMDIVELTRDEPRIEEFILVTSDSDFVPVLQRLSEKGKRTAIVVDEARPSIHTTYRQHADVLIPRRRLGEARQFIRPERGLLGKLRTIRLPPLAKDGSPGASRATVPAPVAGERIEPLQGAVDRVIKVISPAPNRFTAQRKILAALRGVAGFRTQGAGSYLGKGSYKELMKELARRDSRISVTDQARGGTSVMYVPQP